MATTDHQKDSDLLLAYGRDGDEAAFESLAARHVDMIFAVSLRRARNRGLAEEATQNVLLALSRKARRLSVQEKNLTGWLHKSTRFEVSKLQRRESRIRKREQTYADDHMRTSTESDDEAFQRLYPMLDQAIDGLRPPDREVIVRRYLEGQNFSHIGEALGISEDAAQKRTNRAFNRLNTFFKRKAGLTVSATAMTAGLSQHCAEAAPAACLKLAGKATSTGLASLLTTTSIVTMNTSKVTAIAAGLVVLGGTAAFLVSQNNPAPETPSPNSSQASAPSPQKGSGQSAGSGSDGTQNPAPDSSPQKPSSANEELARLEAMSPHPGKDEFARRLSVKHDQLLKDLTETLGLSATQSAALKGVLDDRLKAFRASLETGPEPGSTPADSLQEEKKMVTEAGGIIRGVGLRDDVLGILNEEQLASYDEREEQNWRTEVESHALREFSKLTPVLDLTEEQKDLTFELLQVSSGHKLNESANVRAFMALQKGQDPTRMQLTDLAEAQFLQSAFNGPNAPKPGSPEFKEQITEVVGGQIEAKVDLLAPVLDERQQQRYRDHLFQRSLLPQFGIELPIPEKQ